MDNTHVIKSVIDALEEESGGSLQIKLDSDKARAYLLDIARTSTHALCHPYVLTGLRSFFISDIDLGAYLAGPTDWINKPLNLQHDLRQSSCIPGQTNVLHHEPSFTEFHVTIGSGLMPRFGDVILGVKLDDVPVRCVTVGTFQHVFPADFLTRRADGWWTGQFNIMLKMLPFDKIIIHVDGTAYTGDMIIRYMDLPKDVEFTCDIIQAFADGTKLSYRSGVATVITSQHQENSREQTH